MPIFVLLSLSLIVGIGVALFRSVGKSASSIVGSASSISGNNNDSLNAMIGDLENRLRTLQNEKARKQTVLRQLQNGEEPYPQTAYANKALPGTAVSCKKCGRPIEEGLRFCNHCGEAASPTAHETETCRSCGSTLTGYKRFCPKCGSPVA